MLGNGKCGLIPGKGQASMLIGTLFTQVQKKSSESIFIVQYGNDQFAFCEDVFFGTPLGNVNHEWKSVAAKLPFGSIDSNRTTFFYHDACTTGGGP